MSAHQYYGGYGEIEGGYVHLGLVDLTGGVGSTIKVSGAASPEVASLWRQLLDLHEARDLVGAGSTSGRDTDTTPRGIVKGHAYAVLRVADVDGTRLLQVWPGHSAHSRLRSAQQSFLLICAHICMPDAHHPAATAPQPVGHTEVDGPV